MLIKLSDDVEIEIEVSKTSKTVEASVLYHIWADTSIDIVKIIEAGIRSLSEEDKQKMLKNYKEIWEEDEEDE